MKRTRAGQADRRLATTIPSPIGGGHRLGVGFDRRRRGRAPRDALGRRRRHRRRRQRAGGHRRRRRSDLGGRRPRRHRLAHRRRRGRDRRRSRSATARAPIAVGAGGVWVADTARRHRHAASIPPRARPRPPSDVGAGPTGIAVGAGAVWVANSVRRDRVADRPAHRTASSHTITVGGSPDHVAVAAGRVWVTVQAGSGTGATVAGGTLRIVPADGLQLDRSGAAGQLRAAGSAARLRDVRQAARLPRPPGAAGDAPRRRRSPRPCPTVSAGRADLHVHRAARASASRRPPASRSPARAFQTRDRALPQPDAARPGGRRLRLRRPRRLRRLPSRAGRATSPASAATDTHADRSASSGRTRPCRRAWRCRTSAPVPPDTPISAKGIDAHPVGRPVLHRLPHAQPRARAAAQPLLPRARGPAVRPRSTTASASAPEASAALVESGRADYAERHDRRSALRELA